jgi:hypothetical protein
MQTHTKRLMRQSAAVLAGLAVAGVALGWRAAAPPARRPERRIPRAAR